MELILNGLDFTLKNGADVLLQSTAGHPMIYVGAGKETVDMYRGNFKIEDYVVERRPLAVTAARQTPDGLLLDFGGELEVLAKTEGSCTELVLTQKNPDINRFWLRVNADKTEHCYGCGEQMSYFDLRGRHFPLWSSEPGVGRDKTTYVT